MLKVKTLDIADGKFTHLTPRPEKACDLSLENMAVLVHDEKERLSGDLERIRWNIAKLVFVFFCLVSIVLTYFVYIGAFPGSYAFVAFLFIAIAGGLCLHPNNLVSPIHHSSNEKAAAYSKQLTAFDERLEQLGQTFCDPLTVSDLRFLKREDLEQEVSKAGVAMACEIITFEQLGEEGETKALAARKKLEEAYSLWAEFKLVSGGYTEFFRRAHEEHEKTSVMAD